MNLDMRNMQDHYPQRGDQVEAWVKDCRDIFEEGSTSWAALDMLLDEYRLAADNMMSLENMVNGEPENVPREPRTPKKRKK